jgi:hypothetical protein
LFVILFLLYLGGIQVIYWLRIDNAKATSLCNIKNNNISNESVKEFVFSQHDYNSLDWNEKNKEFNLSNCEYDIITVTHLKDGIHVKCCQDDLETELTNAFHGFIEHLFPSHAQPGNSDNDIVSKIIKEYIFKPNVLIPNLSFLGNVLFESEVIQYFLSLPASIWHPPAPICSFNI